MKQTKANKIAKDGINYKKLFFELLAVFAIAFVVVCIVLIPLLDQKGAFKSDKYAKYRKIVEEVDEYDYSQGRNVDLENRLDSTYNDTSKRYEERFFHSVARITYYCNVGYYNTAMNAYDFIEEQAYAPNNEELLDAKVRQVLCKRKNANV